MNIPGAEEIAYADAYVVVLLLDVVSFPGRGVVNKSVQIQGVLFSQMSSATRYYSMLPLLET